MSFLTKLQMQKIMHNERSLLLAYDQGLEHGPTDFNLNNVNPDYILKIAEKGKYNGVILHHGIAEKYYDKHNANVPLIVKLNGKTNLVKNDPVSSQVCSIGRAVKLGADAVGYTIYPGSEFEHKMFDDFGKLIETAHTYGIPVIAWVYPRGKFVQDDLSTETIAYAARIGLELGADFVKINYNNDFEGFKWVVKAAGKAKVLVAGGQKLSDREVLQRAYEVMKAGACGLAVGRNVWQNDHPLKMTNALKKIIFDNKSVNGALKILK